MHPYPYEVLEESIDTQETLDDFLSQNGFKRNIIRATLSFCFALFLLMLSYVEGNNYHLYLASDYNYGNPSYLFGISDVVMIAIVLCMIAGGFFYGMAIQSKNN